MSTNGQADFETLAEWSGLSADDVRRACRGYGPEDYQKAVIFWLAKVFRQKGATRRDGLEIQNQLLQLKLQKQKGDTITISDAKSVLGNFTFIMRRKLLSIPDIFAPRAVYLGGETPIRDELRTMLEDALNELSRTTIEEAVSEVGHDNERAA